MEGINMNEVIKISNLNKSFGDVHAVNDLSFMVKKGELFAFLGINGAGKSTTISIMCNELKRDSGEVIIDGKSIDTNMDEIRTKLGVVYQNNALDGDLTVYDNLRYRAALYGINKEEFEKRLDVYAELLDFKDLYKRTYKRLT